MTIGQVLAAYEGKEHSACPLTNRLIMAGYQQTGDGYISDARDLGMEVNYKKALPSQGWHLMNYCRAHSPHTEFTKSIQCGELIFWMAEVSGCVREEQLRDLSDAIIADNQGTSDKPVYNRRKWNREIQNKCFDAIRIFVESMEVGK